MLQRILEPEVMDTVSEAVDYDQMDHSTVNRVFVDDFLNAVGRLTRPDDGRWNIFDAGTGTAQIPIELMRRDIACIITASDLAEQMLVVARKNVISAGFGETIRLVRSDCKHLSDADATYNIVISNSIVHHIPEPLAVLQELWRILAAGGLLFVRDLMRPDNQPMLDHLVQQYAGTANEHQQQMFRDSLHAALSLDEIRQLLGQIGIAPEAVQPTSDRHWTIVAYRN